MPHRLSFPCSLRCPIWIAVATLTAGLIAWIGAGLQLADRSPLALFSLVLGMAVGGTAVGLSRLLRLPKKRGDTWVVVLLAVGTVAAEHGLIYRELYQRHVAAWEEHRRASPALDLFRPAVRPIDFWSFVSERLVGSNGRNDDAFRNRWSLWLLDLILVVCGAVIVVRVSPQSAKAAS